MVRFFNIFEKLFPSSLGAAKTFLEKELQKISVRAPVFEARVLLEDIGRISPSAVFFSSSLKLSTCCRLSLWRALRRRRRQEPLAYITGYQRFWDWDFSVGSGVLIPRTDTETLIEALLEEPLAIDRTAPLRFLDLGVGSGCLLITSLLLFPHARGWGVEKSSRAFSYAARNVRKLLGKGSRRAVLIRKDWKDLTAADLGARDVGKKAAPSSGNSFGGFDVILANPPYIPPTAFGDLEKQVAGFEPPAALFGDPEEIFTNIALVAGRFCRMQSRLIVEIGEKEDTLVEKVFAQHGWIVYNKREDLSGAVRCLVAYRQGKDGEEHGCEAFSAE